MNVLPENILRCLSQKDRRALGRGAMTASEALEKAKAGEEDRLQSDIRQYLNLHDLQFINPNMRKKSALPKGWPDFSFVYRAVAIVVECKTEEGRLDPDQQIMRHKLQKDGWRYVLAQSLADVQQVFREIDASKEGKSPWPITNQ